MRLALSAAPVVAAHACDAAAVAAALALSAAAVAAALALSAAAVAAAGAANGTLQACMHSGHLMRMQLLQQQTVHACSPVWWCSMHASPQKSTLQTPHVM